MDPDSRMPGSKEPGTATTATVDTPDDIGRLP